MAEYLTPGETCKLVEEELGVERSCIRSCVDENVCRVSCLVHESWLQRFIAGDLSQESPVASSPWSAYEHQLILQPSHPEPEPPWIRISILIIKKPIKKVPLSRSNCGTGVGDAASKLSILSFAELMEYVGAQNCQHSWESALDSYSYAAHCNMSSASNKESSKNVVDEILLQAYGLPTKKLDDNGHSCPDSTTERDAFDEFKEESEGSLLSSIMKHNVVPFVCALEGKSAYFLVEPYFKHNLHNMVTFSPSVLAGSHMRPLFIIYELLRALQWYHNRGMTHGALTLNNVKISKGLWIYLESPDFTRTQGDNLNQISCSDDLLSNPELTSTPQFQATELTSKWTRDDLPSLVESWVHGKISNFDYLMALNALVGRRLGDPNYHPVFPWVTDFSTRNGGYRDLKKSKYRLNKGDRQLDVTYKAALLDSQEGATPHHVSDVLSDITYHVYLARRTPKSVLCDHVRTNWVPNEYPSSMDRLYHWTPDECIPQFFTDTSIFVSIHPDLPDLELPSWTRSAEKFIQWHRSVLESETVSLGLHHWIDLTFGYKLAGKAAVKAKNVYLHLIDKHQYLSNHGVVQLFTEPHPGRLKSRIPHSDIFFRGRSDHDLVDGKRMRRVIPPDRENVTEKSPGLEDSVMSFDSVPESSDFSLGNQARQGDSEADNTKPFSTKEGTSEDEGLKGAQFEPILIPSSFNPLDQLERFEALEKFKNQFGVRCDASRVRKNDETTNFGKLVQADMVSLGCAIVEMLMPARVQLSTCGLTGGQREEAIIKVCETHYKLLPRYARAGVQAFLKGVSSFNGGETALHDAWLPPLTADLLLQPHVGLFPFPSYFSKLHEFLAAFYHSGNAKEEVNSHKIRPPDSLVFIRSEATYTMEQVDIAAEFLPDLLSIVDDEGIKLLLFHLEPLFNCLQTRLHACTLLFDMLAQALGQENTEKTFLNCMVSLFDSHALDNYEVIIRQAFLSQIIVRFGLDGFLKHFISFVVDAVAYKSKLISAADRAEGLSVHSSDDVTPDLPAPETEFSPKHDPLDIAGDIDLPGSLLIEASEHQDDTIGNFSMAIEDRKEHNFSMNIQRVDEDQSCFEKDDEIAEQVTLLPRKITDEEGDGRLFLENISDDEDEVVEVDGGHSSKRMAFHKFHDGLEEGGDVVDDLRGKSNHHGNDPEDLELQPVQGIIDEGTLSSSLFEFQREEGNLGEVENPGGKDSEQTNSVLQDVQLTEAKNGEFEFSKGQKDLARFVDALDEDEGMFEKCTDQVAIENDHNELVGDFNDSLEKQSLTSEEEVDEHNHEETCSDGESRDNGILGKENTEARGVLESSDNNTKPGLAGSPIKTFFNDAKSKCLERRKGSQQHREELTPAAISGIAAESIVWLAPRLGPVLTSKYVASQLLTMLPHCYMGRVGSDDDDDDEKVVNDHNAKWLLFSLSTFCTLYGEAFMLNQYLPYIEKTIRGLQTKVTVRGEGALAAVLSLLKYCIPYLSRDTLCKYSEGKLMTGVFQPVIRILSSYTLTFPGGVAARQAICRSYIDVLTAVCLKLERELARETMTAPVQQFFSCFELRARTENEKKENSPPSDKDIQDSVDAPEITDHMETSGDVETDRVPEDVEDLSNTPAYNELYQTFSASIAHHAFLPLCGIMGSKYMESSLHNHDLIWNLCCSYDVQLSHPTCEDTRASEEEEDGEETGDHVVGGIETLVVDGGAEELSPSVKDDKEAGRAKKRSRPPVWKIGRKFSKTKDVPTILAPSSSDQYLRGSWLTHWENQLSVTGKTGNKFSLQQVKLQTFTGHSGPVRSLYVQDSEHLFLSASKDKTVKLWSLSNHGDGTAQSASSWTYYRHSRQVFYVGMVESVRHAVSCDGSIHQWDPVSGRCLGVFDQPRNNTIVAMTTLPAPSQCVVAAMAEGTAKFLDVRQQGFVMEWKVTTSSIAGTVRDICCSPDGRWIALGFSSGLASVLDVRGGLLRSHRRAHTSEIYQVKAFSNTSFVTSSVDSSLSLWKDDGMRIWNIKGPSDPLPSILVLQDQVISAHMGGKIGVYNFQEPHAEVPYFTYKLSSDVFRGVITCLGYLPLNKLLLIGSDTGNIVLCS